MAVILGHTGHGEGEDAGFKKQTKQKKKSRERGLERQRSHPLG